MRYSKVYYFYLLLIPFIFTLTILYFLEYKFFISSLSKIEYYIQKKKSIKDLVVYTPPSIQLDKKKKNFYYLSAISNKPTLHCRESSYYSMYDSDRYGFNNPDSEWDKKEVNILLLGDSFVLGACVNETNTISGNLRKKLNHHEKSILNLGQAGFGPLSMDAVHREFATNLNINHVFWFFFENNDLKELSRELNDNVLSQYYEKNNFKQDLVKFEKGKNIYFKNHIDQYLNEYNNKNYNLFKVIINKEFLKLTRLRSILKRKDLKIRSKEYTINKKKNSESLNQFKNIILTNLKYFKKKNVKFYFVYLPSFYRYKIGKKYIDQTYQVEITQFLDENNINLIDIDKEVFSKLENPLSLFPFETRGHYNEKGYKLISDIIYKNVKKPI